MQGMSGKQRIPLYLFLRALLTRHQLLSAILRSGSSDRSSTLKIAPEIEIGPLLGTTRPTTIFELIIGSQEGGSSKKKRIMRRRGGSTKKREVLRGAQIIGHPQLLSAISGLKPTVSLSATRTRSTSVFCLALCSSLPALSRSMDVRVRITRSCFVIRCPAMWC